MNNKYDEITELRKFNPYHGYHGYFSSADSATSMTTRTKDPSKQHWADNAIARAKQNSSAAGSGSKTNMESQKEHPGSAFHGGSYDESLDYVKETTGCTEEEAAAMVSGVQAYTGWDSHNIRHAGLGEDGYQDYVAEANGCEEYIKRSPKWDGDAHHGREVTQQELDGYISAFNNGESFDLGGMSSWTSDEEVADNFAGGLIHERENVVANVIIHSNGRMNGTSVRPISRHPGENEILASKDAKFMPVYMNEDESTDIIHIWVEPDWD